MGKRSQQAEALFKEGYNCSQAVFTAFCEDVGMDSNTALLLTSSFGGGMGRLKEVCGAVSAMFMVAGLKYGYSEPKNPKAKAAHYQGIQALAQKFKEQTGSILCRELLEGTAKGQSGQKIPCHQLVEIAARITEDMLEQGMPA